MFVRAEESKLLRWKADAERAGMPFSAWVRDCMEAGSRRLHGQQGAAVTNGQRLQHRTPVRQVRVDPEMRVLPKEVARSLSQGADGRCMADAPRGMRCKVCGRVH